MVSRCRIEIARKYTRMTLSPWFKLLIRFVFVCHWMTMVTSGENCGINPLRPILTLAKETGKLRESKHHLIFDLYNAILVLPYTYFDCALCRYKSFLPLWNMGDNFRGHPFMKSARKIRFFNPLPHVHMCPHEPAPPPSSARPHAVDMKCTSLS